MHARYIFVELVAVTCLWSSWLGAQSIDTAATALKLGFQFGVKYRRLFAFMGIVREDVSRGEIRFSFCF